MKTRKILESIAHCDPNIDAYTIVSAKMKAELAEAVLTTVGLFQQYAGIGSGLGARDGRLVEPQRVAQQSHRVVEPFAGSPHQHGPGVPQERPQTTRAHLFSPSSLAGPLLPWRDDCTVSFSKDLCAQKSYLRMYGCTTIVP